jgi:hypothetical protein
MSIIGEDWLIVIRCIDSMLLIIIFFNKIKKFLIYYCINKLKKIDKYIYLNLCLFIYE